MFGCTSYTGISCSVVHRILGFRVRLYVIYWSFMFGCMSYSGVSCSVVRHILGFRVRLYVVYWGFVFGCKSHTGVSWSAIRPYTGVSCLVVCRILGFVFGWTSYTGFRVQLYVVYWGFMCCCITYYFYFYRWVAVIKLLIILPLSDVRIKINYTKSSSECCTFNEVQIKTRLLILRSEQSLESGKTRDSHCSGWKSIPIIYSPWI